MIRYILKRFLLVIPVLLGATLLVFTIMEFTPGDPAKLILGNEATEEDITNLREEMGLNDPFVVRYVRFVTNMLKGDLGISYRNNLDVSDQIKYSLQGTTQGRYLTGGVPPVRFSM